MQQFYTVNELEHLLFEQEYTTAFGYDITHKDVLNGIRVMKEKHSKCEWIDYFENHPKIFIEGYYWLCSVYFNKTQSLIDADVSFFEQLIENYRKVCDEEMVSYFIKPFIEFDMTYDELAEFVDRKRTTVKKAFYKLPPLQKNNCYYQKNTKYIASSVCEELCRKYFKQTYMKYLEKLFLSLKNSLLEKGIEISYE